METSCSFTRPSLPLSPLQAKPRSRYTPLAAQAIVLSTPSFSAATKHPLSRSAFISPPGLHQPCFLSIARTDTSRLSFASRVACVIAHESSNCVPRTKNGEEYYYKEGKAESTYPGRPRQCRTSTLSAPSTCSSIAARCASYPVSI